MSARARSSTETVTVLSCRDSFVGLYGCARKNMPPLVAESERRKSRRKRTKRKKRERKKERNRERERKREGENSAEERGGRGTVRVKVDNFLSSWTNERH